MRLLAYSTLFLLAITVLVKVQTEYQYMPNCCYDWDKYKKNKHLSIVLTATDQKPQKLLRKVILLTIASLECQCDDFLQFLI